MLACGTQEVRFQIHPGSLKRKKYDHITTAAVAAFVLPWKRLRWMRACLLRMGASFLICAALFLILLFPTFQSETEFDSMSQDQVRSSYKDRRGLLFGGAASSLYYATADELNASDIKQILNSLKALKGGQLKIGLVNIQKKEEAQKWESTVLSDGGSFISFKLEQAAREDLKWDDLFPEWIDEEEQYEAPKCPSLPMPNVNPGTRLDLIVANVPCSQESEGWSRDVARLHAQIAAAAVALSTESPHVLLLSPCRPIPNLYPCRDLVSSRDGTWLFKPDLKMLKKKLSLPVGSCELAINPRKNQMQPHDEDEARESKREAYVTILHSANMYVCGAIVLAESIRRTGSTRDLVVLVDKNIEAEEREGLTAAGWLVKEIERIRNPRAVKESYNEWNYSKFRLWQLTDYDKVVFVDADLLVLRNFDFLFELPELSATANNASLFNSGVMVIQPSNCTFELLMQHIHHIRSYNGGDQGFLNEVFTWWHRLPKHMNYLKYFWVNDTKQYETKNRLFGVDPPELYIIHYLGQKPWLCFRDFDCNWNVGYKHKYASDVAHALWWKVHDNMPQNLQKHCMLRTLQKASLEWNRRQAEASSFSDEHWKRNITDPRLQICNEDFCYWESMLLHWGDPNYNKGSPNHTLDSSTLS